MADKDVKVTEAPAEDAVAPAEDAEPRDITPDAQPVADDAQPEGRPAEPDLRQPRVLRARLKTVVVIGPVFQTIAGLRIAAAAAEHSAEEKIFDFADILERSLISLDHLAHLLFQRHLRQQRLSLRVKRPKTPRLRAPLWST